MTTEVDRLAVLNRMMGEGRISDQEYEELKGEILGLDNAQIESDETVPDDPSTTLSPPPPSDDETQEKKEEPWAPVMRRDVSPVYLVVLVIAAAVLLLASSLGLLSWLLSTIAILALGATLVEGGSWVTMAGAVAIVAILIGGAFGASNNQSADQSVNQASTPAAPPPPVVAGSLGIHLEDLTDLWNTVTEEPNITRGFVHNTEPGQYDSFIYRFGDWGRLAGAYDPSTDALYALLTTGQFSNAATAQLYLHLCFALQPYSQECINSYFEQGLEDGTLTDFVNMDHHAEWQIEDQAWQVDIESNVLTIRVLGADVS